MMILRSMIKKDGEAYDDDDDDDEYDDDDDDEYDDDDDESDQIQSSPRVLACRSFLVLPHFAFVASNNALVIYPQYFCQYF